MTEATTEGAQWGDYCRGVDPKRVEALMKDPNFQSQMALADLGVALQRRAKAGQDVAELQLLMQVIHVPAMAALETQIKTGGWTSAESNAGKMVAQKIVALPPAK